MAAAYEPEAVEREWYQWWESKGFFRPGGGERREGTETTASCNNYFSMILPPPNVTGTLHIGHALTCTLQDALARFHRMRGDNTVWIPGLDHAGIATQSVVERRIAKETGETRHDLGRERLVEEIWDWKEKHGGRINEQQRRLGASLDWSQEVFTLDDRASEAVREAFVRLHDAGLVYRSTRLVNWCSALNTALSDVETDPLDLDGPTDLSVPGVEDRVGFGSLHRFAYAVEAEAGEAELVVATTRPETLFGDTAVAVHPEDPRFTRFHGRHVIQPLTGNRIPIILDAELVDMEKGTGAVKVTPSHDANDFACGQRHQLRLLDIMNDDGTLNGHCGPEFEAMNRLEARRKVVGALEGAGAYRGSEGMAQRVMVCSRSGDVIEPRVKPQWFVDCSAMARTALGFQKSGDLELIPPAFEKTWDYWLAEPKDWCVSRQLWWGHRIPAYKAELRPSEGEEREREEEEEEQGEEEVWVVGRDEDEALRRASAALCVPAHRVQLTQDPDVLDTWFSSGLFPLVCFGWPERDPLASGLYPLSVLETGSDIVFFWVARMAMLCSQLLALEGKGTAPPFRRVFLHPMVRDAKGRKMSKSLGNVVDPIDLIEGKALGALLEAVEGGNVSPGELKTAVGALKADFPDGIPECGTDGLRFALCAYMAQGDSINLDISRVQHHRFMCNKLWQAAKFTAFAVESLLAEGEGKGEWELEGGSGLCDLGQAVEALRRRQRAGDACLAEEWILGRLSSCADRVNESLEAYRFSGASSAIQSFLVSEFCDVYIEFSKPRLRGARSERETAARVLAACMEALLRMLHPIMPFVTEELWQRLIRLCGNPHASPADGGVGGGKGGPESIMLAPFPEGIGIPFGIGLETGDEGDVERAMEEALGVLKTVRSCQHDFRRYLDASVPFSISVARGEEEEGGEAWRRLHGALPLVNSQLKGITAQMAGKEGEQEEDGRAAGTLTRSASNDVSISFRLKYSESISEDIQQMRKRLGKVRNAIERLRARMERKGYAEKVPADVKEKDAEALKGHEMQHAEFSATIVELEQIEALGPS